MAEKRKSKRSVSSGLNIESLSGPIHRRTARSGSKETAAGRPRDERPLTRGASLVQHQTNSERHESDRPTATLATVQVITARRALSR